MKSHPERTAITPIADGESYDVRTFEPRGILESHPDRTVPPAVAILTAPVKARRPLLAVGAAAAAGIALFALLGQLASPLAGAGPARDGHAGITQPPAAAAQVPSPAPDAPSPIVVAPPPVAVSPVVIEVPSAPVAEALPTPVVAKPLVARLLVPALAGSTVEAKNAPAASARPRSDRAALQTTASRTIHGGLSNPGF